MRVLNIIIIMLLTVLPLSAQEVGVDAVSSAGNNISGYMLVVRALCFALAGIVAIGGGYTCYYAMLQGQEIRKRVIMTVGSAMTFVMMALFLPQFFGYTSSPSEGLMAQNSGSGGGDSTSAIITEIPDINDPVWLPDPIYSGGTVTYVTPTPIWGGNVWIPGQVSGPIIVSTTVTNYVHYVP